MRFIIDGAPISVAYGVDQFSGVFLLVCDKRLKYDPKASDEVNAVTNSIGIGDGGGSYFDLHTGARGFGSKVNDQTMLSYLRRFGVPEDRIRGRGLNTSSASSSYWSFSCS